MWAIYWDQLSDVGTTSAVGNTQKFRHIKYSLYYTYVAIPFNIISFVIFAHTLHVASFKKYSHDR